MRNLLLIVLYLISLSANALQLLDGKSFVYDMGDNGILKKGSLNAYANMYQLRVNETNYLGIIEDMLSDREIRTSNFTEPASGLEIARRFYVSKTHNFARYMEILYNPNNTKRVVDVEISGSLGERSDIIALTNQANLIITDDQVDTSKQSLFNKESGSAPTLLHYHSQVGNRVTATHHLEGNQLKWTYNDVIVPANSRIRIVYFIAQTQDFNAANAVANFIFSNPSALYEGLSEVGQSQIINFIPPALSTTDISNIPFLTVGETRTGNLRESDRLSSRRAETYADVYALHLEAGQRAAISMSAHFNSYLYVFKDSQGKELVASNDDDKVESIHAEVILTSPEAMTYYIEATTHYPTTYGDYTIQVRENPDNLLPRAYPFKVKPDILTAPVTVTFTDFSQDEDGHIAERCWQFGDGSPITCHPDNIMTHTFEKAGHFTVSVVLKDDQGALAYRSQLVSIRSSVEGVVLPLASSIQRELPAGDEARSYTRTNAFAERYRINAVSAGKTLLIDMESEAMNSYLYLYDSFNRRLRQNDDGSVNTNNAQLRYTPVDSEDLLVETTTFADKSEGTYRLTLKEVDENTPLEINIEKRSDNNNSLKNLIIARLPTGFNASFLRWDFGDNSPIVSTDKTVISHTFQNSGNFTVNVSALGNLGQHAQGSQTLFIGNTEIAPQAHFTTQPLFGENPLRVFFQNESIATHFNETLSYIWDFGDGTISTLKNPVHHYTQAGTYPVILKVQSESKQQTASFSRAITVIDRNSPYIPVIGAARKRPQVIMAGIDPILLDVMDTSMTIFAIIRVGQSPIQTVRLVQNDSDFLIVMQHVSTYVNGDQRYEGVYTFPKGMFSVATLGNLFGEESGQFNIEVTAQDGQLHTFPNLEIAENPPLAEKPTVLYTPPAQYAGIRRNPPQVLGAGFDPTLIDLATNMQLTLKAIVREGASPIQNVVFQRNDGNLTLPLHLSEILPNGDKLYMTHYPYPQGNFEATTLTGLLGTKSEQFTIIATDQAQQSHRFPELKIGNFPEL